MAGETGWVRSPTWNSERNIGLLGAEAVAFVGAEVAVADPTSGKSERKADFTTGAAATAAVVVEGVPPNTASAVRVAGELAAPA